MRAIERHERIASLNRTKPVESAISRDVVAHARPRDFPTKSDERIVVRARRGAPRLSSCAALPDCRARRGILRLLPEAAHFSERIINDKLRNKQAYEAAAAEAHEKSASRPTVSTASLFRHQCVTLHYIMLRYVALHCIACITLHHITSHYITLHYRLDGPALLVPLHRRARARVAVHSRVEPCPAVVGSSWLGSLVAVVRREKPRAVAHTPCGAGVARSRIRGGGLERRHGGGSVAPLPRETRANGSIGR